MADAAPPCPPSPRRVPPGSPVQRAASAWPIPESGSAHSLDTLGVARSDYRILLVDDDAATLMAMKRHLIRMRGPVQYQGAAARGRGGLQPRADSLLLLRQ